MAKVYRAGPRLRRLTQGRYGGTVARAETHASLVLAPAETRRVTRHVSFTPRTSPSPEVAVPASLTARDFARLSQSLLNTIGAAVMTAMTVGAGLTVTAMLTGLAFGLLSGGPGVSSVIQVSVFLCLFLAGLAAVGAALFVGLTHLLPRALQFVFLTLRAPWFVPSTLVSAPLAGLWRLGLRSRQTWETGLTRAGLLPRASLRARTYEGVIDGRPVRVQRHVFGGALEFRCPIDRNLPPAYIGPQKIAGAVGILLPLVRCPALTDAELLLRDGQLVIRRRWVRPNLAQLVALIAKIETGRRALDLVAELQTLSLLAQWRQLRGPIDERWRSPWFASPAIGRYLDLLKRTIRADPPPLSTLQSVLLDPAICGSAKSWLLSVAIHRLTADQARALARITPDIDSPTTALSRAPSWPAWIGVHLLVLEGGPDALKPLQNLVSSPGTPGPLARAARRAVVRIIQRHGGIHTLTGHLSVVDAEGGKLALVDQGRLSTPR